MNYRMINGRSYNVINIEPIKEREPANQKEKKIESGKNFTDILNKAIKEKNSYTISKHAEQRLKEVNFSESDMQVIEKGFKIAKDKGAKNSVMLYKDVAIITSIENNTVITAVDKNRAKEKIFTNVDSVVIL